LLSSATYYSKEEAKTEKRQTQVPGKLGQVAYADNC